MLKFMILLGLMLLASLHPLQSSHAFRAVSVGSAAPPVAVKDLGGKEIRLAFGQRPVVLLFWRANQTFSLDALKDLEQIRKELSQKGIDVFAIAEGETPAAAAGEATKGLSLSYPVYLDVQRKVEEAYGVIVFPSTGIVGPDARLKFYLPSRNSNYREIILGRLKVELGLLGEKEFEQQMKKIGEELGGEGVRADEHLKVGLRLAREGKSKEALPELKQAAILGPDLIDARLAMGFAYLDSGEAEVAQREFEWVLKRHPASPGARLGIGISTARLGHLDKGIEILKEAVEINPDPVQGYYELGRAYEKKGDLQQAMHAYRWAVRKLLQGRR